MAKNIKTLLKEIATNGATTDKQKQFIREQSEKMGVAFNERTRCNDCYKDQAVILWRIIAEGEVAEGRHYVLHAGVDVIWKGRRINATLTEQQLKELYKEGFPRHFYAKVDED